MTTFVDAILEPGRIIDCDALKHAIADEFGLGAHVEQGHETPLTSHLGLSSAITRLVVSLYDTPLTNVADILGSELDWSPEAEINLPKKVADRIALLMRTLDFISKNQRSKIRVLGIADGGYFYVEKFLAFDRLQDTIMRDIEKDCFLGNIYIF